jgi:hypothetical protein
VAAAFRCQDQLQHLLRILKNVAVLFPFSGQHLGSQLRRHFDSCHGSVFRHVANFVDLDAVVPRQRNFQLFSQGSWLGRVPARERAHESRKTALRCAW